MDVVSICLIMTFTAVVSINLLLRFSIDCFVMKLALYGDVIKTWWLKETRHTEKSLRIIFLKNRVGWP